MIMNTFGLARDNVLHLDFEIYSDKTTAEDAAVKVLRASDKGSGCNVSVRFEKGVRGRLQH